MSALSVLFPLLLFSLVHSIDVTSDLANDVAANTFRPAADYSDFDEVTAAGLQVALDGLRANKNLRLYSVDGLKSALEYFHRSSALNPSSLTAHLNVFLTQALVSLREGNEAKHRSLIKHLEQFPVSNDQEKAILNFYLGYLFENLLFDVPVARRHWDIARHLGTTEWHENFWDENESPKGYIRHQYQHPSSYAPYLLPQVVYFHLRDQYKGEMDAGVYPVFPTDASTHQEAVNSGAALLDPGFDIGMGRKNLEEANAFLKKNEYIALRHFLSQEEVSLWADWYDGNVVNGTWASSYDPTLMRTNVYNDRLGFFANKKREGMMQKLLHPRPVKMAYSFLCHYEDFGERDKSFSEGRPNLRAHTDRKDNEITVSVHLMDPVWPLWVHIPRVPNPGSYWRDRAPNAESVVIELHAGDALVFFGRAHTHWRDTMPEGIRKVSSLLLHYVDYAFDFVKFRKLGEQGSY